VVEGAGAAVAFCLLSAACRFVGAPLDARSRVWLQELFCEALLYHSAECPEMAVAWPAVEPTVWPPRRLQAMEKNRRCGPMCHGSTSPLTPHSYRQAREAYRCAVQIWKDGAAAYRLARRRVRAYRHELYRSRKEVRQEWR
jgi:hypothetical protein